MKPNCYLQMGVGYIFSNASLVGGHEHSFGAEVFVGELPSSNDIFGDHSKPIRSVRPGLCAAWSATSENGGPPVFLRTSELQPSQCQSTTP